jgi:hypothetical protein
MSFWLVVALFVGGTLAYMVIEETISKRANDRKSKREHERQLQRAVTAHEHVQWLTTRTMDDMSALIKPEHRIK